MRVTIRVTPGAPRVGVGGTYADALVVRVPARAVGGAATEAALRALADALGVRRSDVRLVHGGASRTKLVEVDDVAGEAVSRLTACLTVLRSGG